MDEMENENLLTTKNMELMVSWLNGEGDQRPEFAERFMTTMHLMYMNRSSGDGGPLRRERRFPRGAAALSLRALTGITPEELFPDKGRERSVSPESVSPAPTGSSRPRERGSLELAAAVTDIYGTLQGGMDRPRPLTMSFLQAVLYIAYGICLMHNGERLMDEYPQMWKYGPVFARVYSRMDRVRTMAPGAGKRLEEEAPRLHSMLVGVIRSCIDRGMKSVSGELTSAGSPWRKCLETNPDRWGTAIGDRETAEWFSKRNKRPLPVCTNVNRENISA